MRIDKSTYKLFTDHVVYEPVAGVEIRRALQDGIEIFEFEKMPVEVKMNDITIVVNKNAKLDKLVNDYFVKLERKHRQPYNAAYYRGLGR